MPLTEDEQMMPLSHEQRMANYRQRVLEKLREKGVPDDELERQTEELMQRPTGRFSSIFK